MLRDHTAATRGEQVFSCFSTCHDQPKPEFPHSKSRQSSMRLAQGSFSQNGWIVSSFSSSPYGERKNKCFESLTDLDLVPSSNTVWVILATTHKILGPRFPYLENISTCSTGLMEGQNDTKRMKPKEHC